MMMKHGKEVTIPRTKSSEILSLDHDMKHGKEVTIVKIMPNYT